MIVDNNVHKIDIALIQLERACELFFLRDFVCAVTLAGAAEEILGYIAEDESKRLLGRKKERGISSITLTASIMEFSGVDFRTYVGQRNKMRNELKHLMGNYAVDISDIESKAEGIFQMGLLITNW